MNVIAFLFIAAFIVGVLAYRYRIRHPRFVYLNENWAGTERDDYPRQKRPGSP